MNLSKLIVLFMCVVFLSNIVYSQGIVSHSATQVTNGTFGTGDYSFPNNLAIIGNLNASSILYTPQLCLNGDCQTSFPQGADGTGGWDNTTDSISTSRKVGIGNSGSAALIIKPSSLVTPQTNAIIVQNSSGTSVFSVDNSGNLVVISNISTPQLCLNGDCQTSFSQGSDGTGGWINTTTVTSTNLSVGIGTTSPTSWSSNANNLVISETTGTAGITIHSSEANSARIYFANGTVGADTYRGIIGYDHTPEELWFATNTQQRLLINSNGNIGIGTSTPVTKFHIQQGGTYTTTGISDAGLYINATHDYPMAAAFDATGSSDNIPRLRFLNAGDLKWQFNPGDTFVIYGYNSGFSPRLSIERVSGNIGIGTITPQKNLHIDNSLGGSIMLSRSGEVSDTGGIGALLFGFGKNNNVTAAIGSWAEGTNENSSALIFSTYTNNGATHNERMRITNSGNVGIGITSPTQKLDVNGSIALSGNINISTANNCIYLGGSGKICGNSTDITIYSP